jgi:hypothetical protein
MAAKLGPQPNKRILQSNPTASIPGPAPGPKCPQKRDWHSQVTQPPAIQLQKSNTETRNAAGIDPDDAPIAAPERMCPPAPEVTCPDDGAETALTLQVGNSRSPECVTRTIPWPSRSMHQISLHNQRTQLRTITNAVWQRWYRPEETRNTQGRTKHNDISNCVLWEGLI